MNGEKVFNVTGHKMIKISNFKFQISNRKIRSLIGFTLIEFLIIIGIIIVLVGIGLSALKSYQPDLQLSGAVRDLISDLRYAQQLAVAEQINHGIRFSTSTNQYQIIKFGVTEKILTTKDLPEEVDFQQINFTNEEVKFNPYGAAKEPGSVTLINTRNVTTTIEVGPSGFVKIKK